MQRWYWLLKLCEETPVRIQFESSHSPACVGGARGCGWTGRLLMAVIQTCTCFGCRCEAELLGEISRLHAPPCCGGVSYTRKAVMSFVIWAVIRQTAHVAAEGTASSSEQCRRSGRRMWASLSEGREKTDPLLSLRTSTQRTELRTVGSELAEALGFLHQNNTVHPAESPSGTYVLQLFQCFLASIFLNLFFFCYVRKVTIGWSIK